LDLDLVIDIDGHEFDELSKLVFAIKIDVKIFNMSIVAVKNLLNITSIKPNFTCPNKNSMFPDNNMINTPYLPVQNKKCLIVMIV